MRCDLAGEMKWQWCEWGKVDICIFVVTSVVDIVLHLGTHKSEPQYVHITLVKFVGFK